VRIVYLDKFLSLFLFALSAAGFDGLQAERA
jgi:hypothetical protein